MCNQRPDPRPALVNRRRPSGYLQGIDNAEIFETVHARRQQMIPVNTLVRR
jgi:hypothetical protein